MRFLSALSGAAGTLLLAGCAGGPASPGSADLEVTAAFYPLQFIAESVGGDHAAVTALAAPGVEPHDLELSPAAVRALAESDVVLYIGQFQPAVDAALETTGAHGVDAAGIIALHDAEHDHEGDEHAEEDEHDHGSTDPHFWLDPNLLAEYAESIAAEFARLDPQNADDYTANGAALIAQLEGLDTAFAEGLASCERREIITSHEAFGYMADAYGLEQIGIAGIDPENEPSPSRIREITTIVGDTGATTIFAETPVDTSVVDAIARDAGVAIEVLSPVETVADGDDYIAVMERNLATLRGALACD